MLVTLFLLQSLAVLHLFVYLRMVCVWWMRVGGVFGGGGGHWVGGGGGSVVCVQCVCAVCVCVCVNICQLQKQPTRCFSDRYFPHSKIGPLLITGAQE